MKKTKFIALSLVAAFALSGIAYAAWTDTSTFGQQVNSGSFDITLAPVCDKETIQGIFYYGSDAKVNGTNDYTGSVANPSLEKVFGEDTGNSKIETVKLDTQDKSMGVKVTNLFPGTYGVAEMKIQNNGTVPAAVDNVKVEFFNDLGKDDLGRNLWVEVEVRYNGALLGKVESSLGDLEAKLNEFYNDRKGGTAFRFDPSFQIVDGKVTNVALTDKAITHTIKVGMNEDTHVWENDVTENQIYMFTIVYNWKQWNMN